MDDKVRYIVINIIILTCLGAGLAGVKSAQAIPVSIPKEAEGLEGRNQALNFSPDVLIEDFEASAAPSRWQFSGGAEYPGARGSFSIVPREGKNGTRGGKLFFDFTGGGNYVAAVRRFNPPLSCGGVGFWISGYVPGTQVIIRLTDESGQTFQVKLLLRKDVQGQWIQFRTVAGGSDASWGGAGDGLFHGGIAGIAIGVDKNINYFKTGSVILDDLTGWTEQETILDPFGSDAHPAFYHGNISDLLGVNIHFVEPDDQLLDLAKEAGFGFVRMDLFWMAVETARNSYRFAEYDRLVGALQKRGMGAYLILDYANPSHYDGPQGEFQDKWGPRTPAVRSAFAEFARKAAGHYSGKNVNLEVWNEPNASVFWRPEPNPGHYNLLAAAALESIKETAPAVPVVIMATSGVDVHFIDSVFSFGGLENISAVSIHPYRLSAPETFCQERSLVERIIAVRTGRKDIPIYSGEWGYSATWLGGRSQAALKQQALYAIRLILSNLLFQVPKTVWYDLKDDGDDPANMEHNFGLLENHTLNPKPAYAALHAFRALLPGGTCSLAAIETHLSDVHGLMIWSRGGQLAALWTDRKNIEIPLKIKESSKRSYFDMYQKPLTPGRSGAYRIIKLREADGPVYIKGD